METYIGDRFNTLLERILANDFYHTHPSRSHHCGGNLRTGTHGHGG
jgi:hypothetical protein